MVQGTEWQLDQAGAVIGVRGYPGYPSFEDKGNQF